MNLENYIEQQIEWSKKTFGYGERDAGLIDHIKKELKGIEQAPGDIEEWIDVIILALEGAWRNGYSPEEITHMLVYKQIKNEKREWPDWRTAEQGKAIEHIRPTTCEICFGQGEIIGSDMRLNKCPGCSAPEKTSAF